MDFVTNLLGRRVACKGQLGEIVAVRRGDDGLILSVVIEDTGRLLDHVEPCNVEVFSAEKG